MSASVGVLCLIECPERHSCKAGAVLSKLRELRPAPDAYLTLPRIEYCVPGRGFFLPARLIASACCQPTI